MSYYLIINKEEETGSDFLIGEEMSLPSYDTRTVAFIHEKLYQIISYAKNNKKIKMGPYEDRDTAVGIWRMLGRKTLAEYLPDGSWEIAAVDKE